MKARALKPFTMGDAQYKTDQIIDLPDEKIARLISEGLVGSVRESNSQIPIEKVSPVTASIPDAGTPARTTKDKSKKKKG